MQSSAMWKGLLSVVALMTILLPLSDGIKQCNPQQSADVCSLKPETGRCRARFPRYFYNSKSKQCQKFYYGGCGGNGNNFKTLSQCQQKCNACPVKGQVFTTCASPCPKTCEKIRYIHCTAVCKPGCECPRGQVIDRSRNKCVPSRWCSKSKPGSCPPRRRWVEMQLRKRPYKYCRNDSQCSGRKKCCRTGWSWRKTCVTPRIRYRRG